MTDKDKKLLQSCVFYAVECVSRDCTHSFQLVFESIRDVLSFLVTLVAKGLV